MENPMGERAGATAMCACAAPAVKKKSYSRERSVLKGIRMAFGRRFAREIDGAAIQRWYGDLTSAKGLSPGTAVRHF